MEQVRDFLELSAVKFSSKLRIAQNTYTGYKQGRTPPADVLARMVEMSGVNGHWLLTGEGEMFAGTAMKGPAAPADPLPVYGKVRAGPDGCWPVDEPEYLLPRPIGVKEEDAFGLDVSGDSAHPVYKDGDVVICVPDPNPVTGKDYVVTLEWGETVLKRWQWLDADRIKLLSWNEDYAPIELGRAQVLNQARIIGQIWGSLAKNARMETDEMSNDKRQMANDDTRHSSLDNRHSEESLYEKMVRESPDAPRLHDLPDGSGKKK